VAIEQRTEGRDEKCSSEVCTRSRIHPLLLQQGTEDGIGGLRYCVSSTGDIQEVTGMRSLAVRWCTMVNSEGTMCWRPCTVREDGWAVPL
jgi:hypothetical protein